MAKKKATTKKQESKVEEPIKLTEKDRIDHINKINELKGSKSMKLPDNAVVNIPVSGFFYRTFEGLFYHLMEPLNASQILHTMDMIKNNFEGADEEKITNTQRALWAVLTLMSEIHWQAAAQNKLVETDESHATMIEQILHGAEGAPEALAAGLQKHKTAGEKKAPEESDSISKALEAKVKELRDQGMLGDNIT
jgi:hypothetical protein